MLIQGAAVPRRPCDPVRGRRVSLQVFPHSAGRSPAAALGELLQDARQRLAAEGAALEHRHGEFIRRDFLISVHLEGREKLRPEAQGHQRVRGGAKLTLQRDRDGRAGRGGAHREFKPPEHVALEGVGHFVSQYPR